MRHPYTAAAPYRRWRLATLEAPEDVRSLTSQLPFRISRSDRIVTAGSCFAQHVARHLQRRGYNYLVTEPGHPILPPDIAQAYGYGMFTARYGNIYTSRQLLQLLRRAYGRFHPSDDMWEHEDGRIFDPFRPSIQPAGFATRQEYRLDRARHFSAVREAFETLDVFMFTLGLTECWISRQDGAAYPVCPGTAAGKFAPDRHVLHNLGVEEVVQDMTTFISELRMVKPDARVVITVSPVPLAATALERHVLVSNTYSKAVLRVAADALSKIPDCGYFPAYEIIQGKPGAPSFFAEDGRSILEAGVSKVMETFLQAVHAPLDVRAETSPAMDVRHEESDAFLELSGRVIRTMCDEDRLDVDHRAQGQHPAPSASPHERTP